MTLNGGELALVLGGGGARAAYQVGLLRHLAKEHPEFEAPILTGVSAGAINAIQLAARPGDFAARTEELVQLWTNLSVEQVFSVDFWSLTKHLVKWAGQLAFLGGRRGVQQMRGLVDTSPLRETLHKALRTSTGELSGIERRLAEGRLRAIALTSSHYATGQCVSFCQGREFDSWERPQRVGRQVDLSVDHVMASAALPFFFPAVEVAGRWYGDGGIRLHAPLAPAIHLGAQRILAVSTRYGRSRAEADIPSVHGYPPPAQVLGTLMNAIFLDLFDQDAINLERINKLIRKLKPEDRGSLKPIDLLVIRPSVDLGALANDYEPHLPRLFRFLTRRLGTRETKNQDLISLLMFQSDYLTRLIEIGEADAAERSDEIAAFLEG